MRLTWARESYLFTHHLQRLNVIKYTFAHFPLIQVTNDFAPSILQAAVLLHPVNCRQFISEVWGSPNVRRANPLLYLFQRGHNAKS